MDEQFYMYMITERLFSPANNYSYGEESEWFYTTMKNDLECDMISLYFDAIIENGEMDLKNTRAWLFLNNVVNFYISGDEKIKMASFLEKYFDFPYEDNFDYIVFAVVFCEKVPENLDVVYFINRLLKTKDKHTSHFIWIVIECRECLHELITEFYYDAQALQEIIRAVICYNFHDLDIGFFMGDKGLRNIFLDAVNKYLHFNYNFYDRLLDHMSEEEYSQVKINAPFCHNFDVDNINKTRFLIKSISPKIDSLLINLSYLNNPNDFFLFVDMFEEMDNDDEAEKIFYVMKNEQWEVIKKIEADDYLKKFIDYYDCRLNGRRQDIEWLAKNNLLHKLRFHDNLIDLFDQNGLTDFFINTQCILRIKFIDLLYQYSCSEENIITCLNKTAISLTAAEKKIIISGMPYIVFLNMKTVANTIEADVFEKNGDDVANVELNVCFHFTHSNKCHPGWCNQVRVDFNRDLSIEKISYLDMVIKTYKTGSIRDYHFDIDKIKICEEGKNILMNM